MKGWDTINLSTGKPINGVPKAGFSTELPRFRQNKNQFCLSFGSAQILSAFVPTSGVLLFF
ncbi:hypothetical protein CD122_09725 [Staphylococcus rostri]|uniref:Uncharacterized protein n=1 Tax=Staphylococcus rostri TaxID=522262 RepID=A0A2K3YIW9_9STAP|nr:hypothetical protein CD122_09725 [Staphylococcus rostri]